MPDLAVPSIDFIEKALHEMTNEVRIGISDDRLPNDCYVSYHELRGYDSPDKWFEARVGTRLIGKFSTKDDAVDACVEETRGPPWYDLVVEDDPV